MTDTKPLIVLPGNVTWADDIRAKLANDYTITGHDDRATYMTLLVDNQVALILVDGTDSDWRFWTTTPKSSPATRRIPVIVGADEASIREQALIAGANLAIETAELVQTARKLARDHARVPDPALMEQLDCECEESLPPLAVQGVEKFNEGEYYPQHDLFEEQWMETEGPVRDLYRAVLQVGVAYYQIERGNYRGAKKMLMRSVQWLAVLPDVCQGIDVAALRTDSAKVRAELERLGEANFDQFDPALLQPVKLV